MIQRNLNLCVLLVEGEMLQRLQKIKVPQNIKHRIIGLNNSSLHLALMPPTAPWQLSIHFLFHLFFFQINPLCFIKKKKPKQFHFSVYTPWNQYKYTRIYRSVIQKMGKIPIKRWVNKQNVVSTYSRIFLSHKKK